MINNISVHNPVEQIITIRLIMVMESKYIKNFHPKRKRYYYIFIFYLNSLDNKKILFHQLLSWILCRLHNNKGFVIPLWTVHPQFEYSLAMYLWAMKREISLCPDCSLSLKFIWTVWCHNRRSLSLSTVVLLQVSESVRFPSLRQQLHLSEQHEDSLQSLMRPALPHR